MNKLCKYVSIFCMALTLLIASPRVFADFIVTTHDRVAVTSEGLFVSIDGVSVPVESINVANDGYLVALPKPQADKCPACGHDGYIPGRFCRWCNFPDDGKVK